MNAGLLELQGTPRREYAVMGQEQAHAKHCSATGPSSPRVLGLNFPKSTLGLSVKHPSVMEVRLEGEHRKEDFTETPHPRGWAFRCRESLTGHGATREGPSSLLQATGQVAHS